MTPPALTLVAFLAALGSGVIGGVFFAFSNFVMKALARLPVAQGVAAMQAINVVVLNPWFLTIFVGTAIAGFVVATTSVFAWSTPGSEWLLVGGLLYSIGTFLVTVVFNVPRNDMLAAIDPNSRETPQIWRQYLQSWTAWNHVRMMAAILAAASLTVGIWVARAAA